MKTVIFILGYRAMPYIKKGYLQGIIDASMQLSEYKIVYLDNYSRDGSVKYIKEHHPEIDLLLSGWNRLYCAAINCGIQYIRRRYNPDYYILVDADNSCEKNAYKELVTYAETHPNAGIIQPMVYKPDGTMYSCGHYIDENYNCRTKKTLPKDSNLDDMLSCSISSTLIRRELLEKCGLLDEVYQIYWESMDLSFRARKNGFLCACHPLSITYNKGVHVEEIDSYHEYYFRNRNRIIFWCKHDSLIFQKVAEDAHRILKDYQLREEQSDWGLSAQEEATIHGLRDGINLTNGAVTQSIPRIDGYRKGDIILM